MNNGNYIVNNEWLLDLIQFSIKFQSEGALWILETIKNEKAFLPKSKK